MSTDQPQKHDYDTEWKEIISLLFNDFVKFFLPKMYHLIDFSQGVVFLDKEFQKIVKEKNKPNGEGRSFKDKLAKVKLKVNNQLLDYFILIHIEVQSSYKPKFAKRMFMYFYRICDLFNWKTTAIAIYTAQKVPKNYNKFTYNFLGTKLTYEFNTYRVKEAKEKELLASDNPFALVVLASKYLNDSKDDKKKRLKFKLKLIELARERNYSELQIDGLLTFIEYLLILPEDLEEEFVQELEQQYLKTIDNMEATAQSKRLMERLYNKVFGVSVEEIKQKAAQDTQRAIQIQREAEQQQREAEQQQRKADKQQREAKKYKREAEHALVKTIKILSGQGMSLKQISVALELSLERVEELSS